MRFEREMSYSARSKPLKYRGVFPYPIFNSYQKSACFQGCQRINSKYLLLVNLILQAYTGAPRLKHRVLGIVHLIYLPYLCTRNRTSIRYDAKRAIIIRKSREQTEFWNDLTNLQKAKIIR